MGKKCPDRTDEGMGKCYVGSREAFFMPGGGSIRCPDCKEREEREELHDIGGEG